MPLIESILTIFSVSAGGASGAKTLEDFLRSRAQVEEVLTKLVARGFTLRLPRLRHLCISGEPTFDRDKFLQLITSTSLDVTTTEGLRGALLPLLSESVSLPNVIRDDQDVHPVYQSIIESALRGMWRKIGSYEAAAREVLLSQNELLIDDQRRLRTDLKNDLSDVGSAVAGVSKDVNEIQKSIKALAAFAQTIPQQAFDKLTDASPPAEHTIGTQRYVNPFLLVRAEDFNHNYNKLARLFQHSPEWDAIQSRTENVFIEGGRGSGKSMLLRRLTAQATIEAKRIGQPNATFEDVDVDYFGVYVKLTRGYYEQFKSIDTVNPVAASLLAQQELNIEIFDAFIDTIEWLVNNHALSNTPQRLDSLAKELSALFSGPADPRTLTELKLSVIRREQEQIIKFYREKAFAIDVPYGGTARETVGLLRQLSQIFHTHLFPNRQMRLFLLIDEFETLLEVQQVALNTVMKMRLPDLSMKIAVRKAGRKTADTFTERDPIQQPRDYTEVRIDYDVSSSEYRTLLEGIAEKRLIDADYPQHDIKAFLAEQGWEEEISADDRETELRKMWLSGQRRTDQLSAEFRSHYGTAATYRYLAEKGKRKSFGGFSQYALLSSGITSNFMELCKYAFYFALHEQLPLRDSPAIPSYLQTEAAYRVSQRLLSTIDGNVPMVGSTLARLLTDLGSVLRSRLLHHASEPEANRLAVADYEMLSQKENETLAKVIDGAVIWSVLHFETEGEAYRPKNAARPPSADLIINRIYCPALGIPPRARWAVKVSVGELRGLIDPNLRNYAYQRLMRTVGAEPHPTPQMHLYERSAVS